MDYLSLFLSVFGLFLNARSNWWCWPVWVVGNVTWTIYAIQTRQLSIFLLQLAYFGVNVYGWRNWKRI